MSDILITAGIYTFTMILGYWLKKIGILQESDKRVLSNVIFYVTLPGMLISSFSGIEVNLWFIVSLALGALLNIMMIAVSMISTTHETPEMQAFFIINGAGLNLGNIAIPYLRNFMPGGIPYLCMFDVGDSLFTLGTTYAIACMKLRQNSGAWLKNIFLSLIKSVPFDVYIGMTILSAFKITLPDPVVQLADFAGKGNGALVMLMVGVSLNLDMSRDSFRIIARILMQRYLCGAVIALLTYYFIPAPLAMRQIIAVASFSAAANACLIYTERIGIHTDISSALNTVSTLLMIPIISALVMLV